MLQITNRIIRNYGDGETDNFIRMKFTDEKLKPSIWSYSRLVISKFKAFVQ